MFNNSYEEIEISEGNISNLSDVYTNFQLEFSSEGRDENYLYDLMNRKKYHLFLAKNRLTQEKIGYAFLFKSTENKFLWLDYIAVFQEFRNSGYGKAFVQKLIDLHQSEYAGIFLEIDNDCETEEEYEDVKRRIKFYNRFGAIKLDVNYCYPLANEIVRMDLYFMQLNALPILKSEFLKNSLKELFDYFYDQNTLSQFSLSFLDDITDVNLFPCF